MTRQRIGVTMWILLDDDSRTARNCASACSTIVISPSHGINTHGEPLVIGATNHEFSSCVHCPSNCRNSHRYGQSPLTLVVHRQWSISRVLLCASFWQVRGVSFESAIFGRT